MAGMQRPCSACAMADGGRFGGERTKGEREREIGTRFRSYKKTD